VAGFRVGALAQGRMSMRLKHCVKTSAATFVALLASTHTASAQTQGFNSFMDNYFGYMVFAAIAFWWWRRRKRNKLAAQGREQATTNTAEFRRNFPEQNSRDALLALGATESDRAKRIDDIFNHRSESLTFEMKDPNPGPTSGIVIITGTFVRALAAMAPRERESLRAAYHLFNMNEFDAKSFCHVRLALIYGDGKAQNTDARFYGRREFQDQPEHS